MRNLLFSNLSREITVINVPKLWNIDCGPYQKMGEIRFQQFGAQ